MRNLPFFLIFKLLFPCLNPFSFPSRNSSLSNPFSHRFSIVTLITPCCRSCFKPPPSLCPSSSRDPNSYFEPPSPIVMRKNDVRIESVLASVVGTVACASRLALVSCWGGLVSLEFGFGSLGCSVAEVCRRAWWFVLWCCCVRVWTP